MINQQLYEDPWWGAVDHTNAKHSPNVQSQPFGRLRSFEPGVLSAFILTAKLPYLTRKVSVQILRRN